jgi:hypothetical protein
MVKVVCGFTWVTQVILVYGFGKMFFFNWTWVCYRLFFSRIVKKIVSKKRHVIKLYKVHGSVHRFGWLTWFASLESLTLFFNFIYRYWVNWEFNSIIGFDLLSIKLLRSQKISRYRVNIRFCDRLFLLSYS